MQVAPPADIYERPNSRWVADFIGEVNMFEGRLGDDGMTVDGTHGRPPAARRPRRTPSRGKMVFVAVRPEKVRISREPPAAGASDKQRRGPPLMDIGYLGEMSIYKLRIRDGVVKAAVANTGARQRSARPARAPRCG